MPHKVAAGHKGDMGGYAFFGTDPGTRRPFLAKPSWAGAGAEGHEDGENATVSICQGDVQNAPIELQELYYPVMIEQHRLREGSGGAGKFRGGLGIEITVRTLCDASVNINVERTLTPPWGLFGGQCGEPAKALVKQDSQRRRFMGYQAAQLSTEEKRQRHLLHGGRRRLWPGRETPA